MPLSDYRTLGRSGLVVSPLALGTMTFGTARWGSGEADSRAVFDAYIDAGGNFVDTADVYASGRSETLLGQFINDRSLRPQIVIATKAGFSIGSGPNRGGNGSSHLNASINASLRRLVTDYLDMYFVHTWDGVTPADELIETMASLVRSGKTQYCGMSNAPAWYVAQDCRVTPRRERPNGRRTTSGSTAPIRSATRCSPIVTGASSTRWSASPATSVRRRHRWRCSG